MKIEKAIEILGFLERTSPDGYHVDEKPAIKLGREALKRIWACRRVIDIPYNKPLPGETAE